jgi:predicted DNA-binding transcriptional regulator YafY
VAVDVAAAVLAEALGISLRTLYRDIALDLDQSPTALGRVS